MNPVFIGGCGRSGTTLLGNILGRNPRCITVPESQFKTDIYAIASQSNAFDSKLLIEELRKHWRFVSWDLNLDIIKNKLLLSTNYSDFIINVINCYGRYILNKEGDVWIDHTPSNLRHSIKLNTLFENSKYVHIVRDGRAVAASVMKLNWGPNTILKSAHWWIENLAYCFATEAFFDKDKIIRIRYEDLLINTEFEIKKLCNFLDIEFCNSMLLTGSSYVLPNYTTDQHRLITKAPDITRIDKWKHTLSMKEIEQFESVAGRMLELTGYNLMFEGLHRETSLIEIIYMYSKDAFLKYFVNPKFYKKNRNKIIRSNNNV